MDPQHQPGYNPYMPSATSMMPPHQQPVVMAPQYSQQPSPTSMMPPHQQPVVMAPPPQQIVGVHCSVVGCMNPVQPGYTICVPHLSPPPAVITVETTHKKDKKKKHKKSSNNCDCSGCDCDCDCNC